MLTRKQHELLMFIHERLEQDGVPPSFDEMKDALALKSKSGIHRLITGLEERGFIRRLPHRARALEVLRLPEDARGGGRPALPTQEPAGQAPAGQAPAGQAAVDRPAVGQAMVKGFAPNVIPGNFPVREEPQAPLSATSSAAHSTAADGGPPPGAGPSDTIELPLFGRIAAGTPIEALRDPTNSVAVPPTMLGSGDHYALEVAGDSMVDAGIFDGDTVIIRQCDTADTGSIVVALVDDQEATLKRLRRKGASIALEPANTAYETRIFGPDRVKIQGRLVGLLRQY